MADSAAAEVGPSRLWVVNMLMDAHGGRGHRHVLPRRCEIPRPACLQAAGVGSRTASAVRGASRQLAVHIAPQQSTMQHSACADALLSTTSAACRLCVAVAAAPCERFAEGPGLPPCKVNELRWCQTDLAANVYSWPRFMADDMRFGVLDSGSGANHDGYMADVVRARNWKVGGSRALGDVAHSVMHVGLASLGYIQRQGQEAAA